MKENIMDKATFAEICKIMKNKETDIRECIQEVFGTALLFFPALLSKETAMLVSIGHGVNLLGAKEAIEKSIGTIANTFKNKNYTDFMAKYEHAQIAQVLIVFSAYFDSIKLYLPDEEGEIKLSSKEKYKLTEDAIDKYSGYLKEKSEAKTQEKTKGILEYDLSMPNPIQSLGDYLKNLKEFYQILNYEFIGFYEQLSFWEDLKEQEKDRFGAVIRELPDRAVENYQKQYYELAVEFNGFFIWSNMQEHGVLEKKIDVGFANICKLLQTYYEKNTDKRAVKTLEKYERKYKSYIEKPVIDTAEMDYEALDGLDFPNKGEIFVPQSFKALTYKEGLHLEQPEEWNRYDEREEIGKFISDTLRHPVVGALPLLVLGHPGAGKSLLCNMLAAKILFHEYHVIIIRLRDTVADETIQQQINRQIEGDFSDKCKWSDIAESKLDKPVLLIFDGYDELLQASGRTYADYLTRIADFQKDQKIIYGILVKCMITSRITLIDKAFMKENTPVIKLSDFGEERIKVWCEIWNKKNETFFENNELEPFEVDRESNVYELARQPLLLIMLALFDSKGNALKRKTALNSTQLYDSLIREFNSREKRKDVIVRSKQNDEQAKLIDAQVRRISIAALGMYNRKTLCIRSSELQSDIEFIEPEEDAKAGLKDAELKESDKLIGSFFFIHKSDSTDISDREKVHNTAYEFLHNTFGEFLTANFIVSELYNILKHISVLLNNNMQMQLNTVITTANCKKLYICLAYAPLFSRPVVVEMIHEWSDTYLKNKGMSIDDIDAAMDFLVTTELKRIISGETIFSLKEITEEKNNPFMQQEIIKHVAIYSMNILILRTIICRTDYTVEFEKYGDNKIWDKLICLWKYTFSEDDLLSYANKFEVNKQKTQCKIVYDESKGKVWYYGKLAKLLYSSFAIGDNITFSVIGTLTGNFRYNIILDALKQNKLDIKARYMWNYMLSSLSHSTKIKDSVFSLLDEYRNYCFEEKDVQCIFSYYLLLNYLLKEKIIEINNANNHYLVKAIAEGLDESFYYQDLYNNKDMVCLIKDMVLSLLDYVVLEEEDVRRIFESYNKVRLMYTHGLADVVQLYNRIITNIVNGKSDKKYAEDLVNSEDFGKRVLKAIERNKTRKIIYEVFELSYNLLLLGDFETGERIIKAYVRFLQDDRLPARRRTGTLAQKSILIKCLYVMHKENVPVEEEIAWSFKTLLNNIPIKELFHYSQESAFQFCCLLGRRMNFDHNELMQDLLWIVKRRGDLVSIHFWKQMLKLARCFHCSELEAELFALLDI